MEELSGNVFLFHLPRDYIRRTQLNSDRMGGNRGEGKPNVRGFNWATLFLGIWMRGPGPPGTVSLK
jgi:hypothetical protein